MKIETAVKKAVEFLQNNPGSSKEQLGAAIKIKGLELTNLVRALKKQNLVTEEGEGKEVKFTIKAEAETGTEEPVVEEETTPAENEPKAKKGRNNDKYSFNGNTYGKGPLVREVVREYVAGHPKVTLKQLLEVFPTELLKPVRFGIVQEIEKARELSGARDRYFFKEEHQIKLGDKKTVVVCSQFTAANIVPFLAAAKKLGFKIK